MKIAQVAPLYESVPPRLYGGTERVVSTLTEELIKRGHEVTLFASGDSVTSADLVPSCEMALRLDSNCRDPIAPHILFLQRVFAFAKEFDLIHFHLNYLHFPLARLSKVPHVTTEHGRLDLPDYKTLFGEFADLPLVSISNAQREPLPNLNWAGTVYHGLHSDQFKFQKKPGDYLAFLGRISPEKGPDRAIQIAIEAGVPLKIAAKVDSADQVFFETKIKHLLDHPLIDFIGEIEQYKKSEFLGGAKALLFPISWPEPFGLVMIEALACGTPVIAFRAGSVPEIVENGKSGFIINNLEEAVSAVKDLSDLNRQDCRNEFEERFTVERMANEYLKIYDRIIEGHRTSWKSKPRNPEIIQARWPNLHPC